MPTQIIKFKAQVVMRKIAQWRAQKSLSAHPALWSALQEYLAQTDSTGCSQTDYWQLYQQIRAVKPREILECGTGVSTLVIAHALMENERETGVTGRVTSMEEVGEWLDMSRKLLPDLYHPYVDFRLSDTVDDSFSLFRGVRYRDVPLRDYDFVFVDGPKYKSPIDGVPTFDFDFIHVLLHSNKTVSGLVDKRVSTCFALQQILGYEKVRYDPILHIGFIAPCTRHDLGELTTKLSSSNFEKTFAFMYGTRLSMGFRSNSASKIRR